MVRPSSIVCDVCSSGLRTGSGYILRTGDVVSSPRYWEHSFKQVQEMGGAVSGALVIRAVGEMSQKQSPWIICDGCIDLFDADRAPARDRATKYWATGETPTGGAGDQNAALQAAFTAFADFDTGGFPLEWPQG